jgi:hypothetical protein
MPPSQEEITVISRDVVRSFPRPLDFVGVTASEGGSNRVEGTDKPRQQEIA